MLNAASGGFADLNLFGVGILATSRDNLHVGMVYKKDQKAFFCHFAWHLDILKEDASAVDGLLWANSSLDPINAAVMADWADKLGDNSTGPPYGFRHRTKVFDSENGRTLAVATGEGLTCSSFVYGAYEDKNLRLLDKATWLPRTTDVERFERLVDLLESYCKKNDLDAAEHIKEMRKDVNAIRVRPEEVAAAVISSEPSPVNFESIEAASLEIAVEVVERRFGRPSASRAQSEINAAASDSNP